MGHVGSLILCNPNNNSILIIIGRGTFPQQTYEYLKGIIILSSLQALN